MSCHRAVVTLALVVVGPLVSAETSGELWLPGSGVAKLYSWNYDFSSDNELELPAEPLVTGSHSVVFHSVLQQLAFVAEDAVDTRVHANFSGHTGTVASGAGLGAGAGKGSSQVTMADANAAATKAAGAAVAARSDAKKAMQSVRGGGSAAAKSKQPLTARSWFHMMRFSLSFAFVVKSLCMMVNCLYQASPLTMVTTWKEKGDTGGADLAPYIAVAYGGWQWCFYGLFAYMVTSKSGFLVLVYSNVVGATLGLYYVWAFTMNCRNVELLQKSTKYYYVLGCIAFVQFVAILSLQPVRALFFSGLISSAWSTIASCALVTNVGTVFRKRSSASLPLPLLLVGEISAMLWIMCGVMLWDPWITFPNTFSLMVCSWALYLCWRFPPDGPEAEPASDDEGEVFNKKCLEKEVDFDEPLEDFDAARASPLQRALSFVNRSSASSEKEPLRSRPSSDQQASSRLYGGTGGTGDGF